MGRSCFFGENHHAISIDKSPSVVYTCTHVVILEVKRKHETKTFFNRTLRVR